MEILIKNSTLNITIVSGNTNLSFVNNYYSYNQSGLNSGIVTEFNVRQFLDNTSNSGVTNSFIEYLESNSTNSELQEIYDSNQKLASVFTKYYNTTVLSGSTSPTSYINNELISTSSSTVHKFYHYLLQDAAIIENTQTGTPANIISSPTFINEETIVLNTFTSEESYYLPIKLNLTIGQTSKLNFFEEYSKDEIIELQQGSLFLKQSFVELNKQPNFNIFYSDQNFQYL